MKTKLQSLAFAFLFLFLIYTPIQAATCTVTVPAGGDIQAAINAASPGAVICLSPGVYSPTATIIINKSITLQGTQAGVDPRPSAGTIRTPGSATEAIIDGGGTLANILKIAADDVTIDGIEVRNGTGDLVMSDAAAPIKYRTKVRYCIVHNSSGDEGMQLRNVTDGIIEFNYVYATTGDAINLCCESINGIIRCNEVHNISSPDGAIYVYSSSNTQIKCNLVYDVKNNDGIKLGAKGGTDSSRTGGSVIENTVHDTYQDGISIYMSDSVVECNEVYNSTSENGGIYVAQAVANITIQCNAVHDNTFQTFKWGNPGGIMIGTAVNAATVTVSSNSIYNNSPNGLTNKALAQLVAENNWWGNSSGPYHPTLNPSGTGNAVSDNVDFTPWLLSLPSCSCPGCAECESPTLIQLSSFTAIPKNRKVILEWETESEVHNAGFNIYRSEVENGEYTKINENMIVAKGTFTQGASYEFIDPDVQNRKIYYYKLEDIDLNGTSTMHGPVSATPRLIYGIFR